MLSFPQLSIISLHRLYRYCIFKFFNYSMVLNSIFTRKIIIISINYQSLLCIFSRNFEQPMQFDSFKSNFYKSSSFLQSCIIDIVIFSLKIFNSLFDSIKFNFYPNLHYSTFSFNNNFYYFSNYKLFPCIVDIVFSLEIFNCLFDSIKFDFYPILYYSNI